ncbi:MAG TPA: hypothetical protein VK821_13775 [Dehalococcoidia bacterium]|nr:hypothetical protein [Dehalococcoidia bacterium]
MPKWNKQVFRLAEGHGWQCRPGFKSIVGDRGAFRFDIPADWFFEPGTPTLKFYDREPPNDDILLEVTPWRLPDAIDWSDLPLKQLFEEATKGEPDELIWRGEAIGVERRDLEMTWHETYFVDPGEHREARSRTLLARQAAFVLLLTLSFWPDDAERSLPIWDEVLRSLRMGQHLTLAARRGRN